MAFTPKGKYGSVPTMKDETVTIQLVEVTGRGIGGLRIDVRLFAKGRPVSGFAFTDPDAIRDLAHILASAADDAEAKGLGHGHTEEEPEPDDVPVIPIPPRPVNTNGVAARKYIARKAAATKAVGTSKPAARPVRKSTNNK